MPSPTTSEFPKPRSWDEFEDIVWELYAREWQDPNTQSYGRTGQAQHGVDIYGRPTYLGGRYAGIQCKRYDAGNLNRKKIEDEIARAEEFRPPLVEYLIATTEPRDATLQRVVRLIDGERRAKGQFGVRIVFWDDLCSLLANTDNSDLLRKHYWAWLALGAYPIAPSPAELSAAEETYRQRLLAAYNRLSFVGLERSDPFLSDVPP